MSRPCSRPTRSAVASACLQMRESARLIGAQLSLDSSPGQGTQGAPADPGAVSERPPERRRSLGRRNEDRALEALAIQDAFVALTDGIILAGPDGIDREREPRGVPRPRRRTAHRPHLRGAAARHRRRDGPDERRPSRASHLVPARGPHGRPRDREHVDRRARRPSHGPRRHRPGRAPPPQGRLPAAGGARAAHAHRGALRDARPARRRRAVDATGAARDHGVDAPAQRAASRAPRREPARRRQHRGRNVPGPRGPDERAELPGGGDGLHPDAARREAPEARDAAATRTRTASSPTRGGPRRCSPTSSRTPAATPPRRRP